MNVTRLSRFLTPRTSLTPKSAQKPRTLLVFASGDIGKALRLLSANSYTDEFCNFERGMTEPLSDRPMGIAIEPIGIVHNAVQEGVDDNWGQIVSETSFVPSSQAG